MLMVYASPVTLTVWGSVTASVSKFGRMGVDTKGNGNMIKPVDRVSFGTVQAILMKEVGLMIKQMDSGFISIWMALGMKEVGKMTFMMGMEQRLSQMAQNFREDT